MIVSIQISSDVHAAIAEEAKRRGMRIEDLAGLKLAGAVLADSDRVRTLRRSANCDLQNLTLTLKSVGIERAEFAIATATAKGLSEAAIHERIATWRRLPNYEREPGKLYNWLVSKSSYASALRRLSESKVEE